MDERLFQDLITGLQEMVDHAKGKKDLQTKIRELEDRIDREKLLDQMTDDQKIEYVGRIVLIRHKDAFVELAK